MSIARATISDSEWARISPELSTFSRIKVGNLDKCRQFISAVLWLLRGGMEWRMLPAEYGKWNSVFKRYSRWCAHGVWDKLLDCFTQQADWQDVSIDGTINRAHACAAGYKKDSAEALGRSKGGFSCKIHGASDAHGMPLKFILTGGQVGDCAQAIPLLETINAEAVLADKAYETNELRGWLKVRDIKQWFHPSRIEKTRFFVISGTTRSDMLSNACSGNWNTTVEYRLDMRKKQ